MKKIVLYAIAVLLILCGCKKQPAKPADPTESQTPTQTTAPTQPSETATPTTPSKPTETTIPTETTAPTETTVPTETVPKELTVADWQLEQPKYLSYEDYFSTEREFSGGMWEQSSASWIKGDRLLTFMKHSESGHQNLVVCCREENEIYTVPNSSAYAKYQIVGSDGRYGYLSSKSQFLRIDLTTGKAEMLLDEQSFCGHPYGGIFLCDNLVVYYASYVNGELTVGRIYLPTLKNETLYNAQGEYYDLQLNKPKTNKAAVVWTLKNPEFISYLKTELADPNSKIQKGEYYDYSELWKTKDAFSSILNSPMHLHYLQDAGNQRALLKCSLDLATKKLTQQTGIMDSCFHGSDFGHDHYNPEVTTAPEPEVIMSQWTKLDAKAAALLHREKDASLEANAKVTVMIGADSQAYLYTKTDGDYKKVVDAPIGFAIDTGTCIVYTSADKQTLFAISYDGTQSAELLRATSSGFLGSSIGYKKNHIALQDGDTLVALDLVEGTWRQLIRHQHMQDYFYIDSSFGSDKVYFEVCVGMFVAGYTIDISTGELKAGYRL